MKPRSGKRSGSNSESPPERRRLLIDRGAWSAALGTALGEANIPFEAHHDHFRHDMPDSDWLAAAADRHWLVITRDKRIRYTANELAAVRKARLHLFVFTQGSLSAAESGRIVVACYPAILRAASNVTAPAFFSMARSGRLTRLGRIR